MVNEGKKVNWRRRRWLSSIGLMGLLLLFSHQNCAPAGGVSSGSSTAATAAATNDSQTIQLGDEGKSTADLSFSVASELLTAGSSQNSVVGVCSTAQEGSILAWKVEPIETDGTLGGHVMDGFATCSGGQFSVPLGAASQLTCGSIYRLTAQLGVATPGLVSISLPCH